METKLQKLEAKYQSIKGNLIKAAQVLEEINSF